MPSAPCKNCPDRSIEPNCHTNCKKYHDFTAEIAKTKEIEAKNKEKLIPKNSKWIHYK